MTDDAESYTGPKRRRGADALGDALATIIELRAELARDRRRWAAERRWPVALSALAFATALVVAALGWVVWRDQESDRAESCANREVLRAVISESALPGRPIRFDLGDRFDALPPEVQDYLLHELAPALAAPAPSGSSFADRALALVPPC